MKSKSTNKNVMVTTKANRTIHKAITITGVRDHLLDVFHGLKTGAVKIKEATELNNTAGKIISSAKTQLAYHYMRQEKPRIPFLDGDVVVDAKPKR